MKKISKSVLGIAVLVLGPFALAFTDSASNQPAETNTGDTLVLSANMVFFSRSGTLRNVAIKGATINDPYNQNEAFDYTTGWQKSRDTLVWPVRITNTGELTVTPFMGVNALQNGAEIDVVVGEEKKTVVLKSTGKETSFANQQSVSFSIRSAGDYLIQLAIRNKKGNDESNIGNVKSVKLTGAVAASTNPIRVLHRSKAIHAHFRSTSDPKNVEWFIGESTILTPDVGATYQPWTTPFGYYGSLWNVNDHTFTNMNFSLWSFSRKAEKPDPARLSHIIGVRDGFYIDGFNHEGTGVKPRTETVDLYEKNIAPTQVLAFKKVPGKPYDTYYAYYWDLKTKEWKFYSCGKKYNGGDLKDLKVGSFIEDAPVAGPAGARTGYRMREVKRRGWFMDKNGKLYPMDKMEPSGSIEPYSYKNWGITSDNQFFLQMGGLKERLKSKPRSFILPVNNQSLPEYLSKEALQGLNNLPAIIQDNRSDNIGATKATVHFSVKGTGPNPEVNLYWGTTDALTFENAKNKGAAKLVQWDNSAKVTVNADGSLSYTINELTPGTRYYYRLQVRSDKGEMWSFDTGTFTTASR